MDTVHYHEPHPFWSERLPGGHHWSGRIQKGTVLQVIALGADANLSLYLVNANEKLERFNMPDTLKAQHTAFLSKGHVLYSDLGRVMASIVKDTHGWNDVLCGPSTAQQINQRYGQQNFEVARNQMYRNGFDSLLIEMAKFGLSRQDLSATVNLFSKVVPNDAGELRYVDIDNTGHCIELRFEMDCLVFLSNTPHALDTSSNYTPADLDLAFYKALALESHDVCRDACPQNQRGFQNNQRYFAISAEQEA